MTSGPHSYSATINATKGIATKADVLESIRQDMNQESANELLGRQGHLLLSVVVTVILPLKRDLVVFDVR